MYRNSKELNIEEMAEAGDRYSCACLGEMYVCGDGVHENISTAVYRCRKTTEQGHDDAQSYPGLMYENGDGVDPNKSAAVYWYSKAEEQGHADAQRHLGLV